MHRLRYFTHSPFCRKVRLVLGEKKIRVAEVSLRPWEHDVPLSSLPTLSTDRDVVLSDSRAIAEYLDETCPSLPLIAGDALTRATIRRWVNHLDECVWNDVTSCILRERVFKRYAQDGDRQPDLTAIKTALLKLRMHLQAVESAVGQQGYFTPSLSLADLTAAAHLSVLDYFGDVPWAQFPNAKEWYASIKSRPSFRPLLADILPGFPPATHYADLDF